MKKVFKFSPIVLLFFPLFSFCQFNSSFEINAGMLNTYRCIKSSDTSFMIKYILSSRDSSELSKLNWKVGLNYNKRLTQHIILKSGLNIRSMGYKTKVYNLPELGKVQFFQNYWFFDIPVSIRYELNSKKILPFVEIGILPSIYFTTLFKQKTDIETERKFDWDEVSVHSFKRLHIVANLNLGLNYLINENYQTFIQTSGYYHISPLADAPVKEYQFGYGLEIGLRKKID